MQLYIFKKSDPYGTRTRVTAVKGRCLNRLTNGPYNKLGIAQDILYHDGNFEYKTFFLIYTKIDKLSHPFG